MRAKEFSQKFSFKTWDLTHTEEAGKRFWVKIFKVTGKRCNVFRLKFSKSKNGTQPILKRWVKDVTFSGENFPSPKHGTQTILKHKGERIWAKIFNIQYMGP